MNPAKVQGILLGVLDAVYKSRLEAPSGDLENHPLIG